MDRCEARQRCRVQAPSYPHACRCSETPRQGLNARSAFTVKVARVFENEASARIHDIRVPEFPADAMVRRTRQMP